MARFKKLTMGRHCFRGGEFPTKDGSARVHYKKQIVQRGEIMDAPQAFFEGSPAWEMMEADPIGVKELGIPGRPAKNVDSPARIVRERTPLVNPKPVSKRVLELKHSGKGRWSVINVADPDNHVKINDDFLTKQEAEAMIEALAYERVEQ
jgi:hypothetical protein